MTDDRSLTEQVAAHVLRPVEPATRDRARLHLLDWLACVGAARRGSVALALAGDGTALSRAAWLGNVLEMDDVHRAAILHPGPVVWPAALAGPARPTAALLDAGVRGYEATIAVGATFDARHYAFYHNTASAGVFGAAAASLANGDVTTLASALGLAGSVSGGLWQMRHAPGDAKQWHVAHAVETGARAAHFATLGMRGPRHILEGPQGLYAATCTTPKPLSLSQGWQIEAVSFKPWGACRHAHPAIDAALELKAQGLLDGAVSVETYADALTFCDRPDPASVLDAKFSLQHAVAIVIERGVPQLADFEPAAIDALAATRARVTVREDAEFTERFPAHFGARVGTPQGSVTLIDTRGDPERPLSRDGVIAKAHALLAWGGVDADGIDACLAAALEADDTQPVLDWLAAWL
jgi:2-methylcitrate dehydratase PrpD